MGRLTDADEELQKIARDLARATEQRARKEGCYRDPETQEIKGYFFVNPSIDGLQHVSWDNWFPDEKLHVWEYVRKAMFQLGIPIAYQAYPGGYYIGVRGESLRTLQHILNGSVTRLETFIELFQYTYLTGELQAGRQFFHERLRKDMQHNDLEYLYEAIGAFLSGNEKFTGIIDTPRQLSFADLQMLRDKNDPSDGDSAAD